jgi:hypothetical protein
MWLSNLHTTEDGDMETEIDILNCLEEIVFSPQFPDHLLKELIHNQEINSVHVIDAARHLLKIGYHQALSQDVHTKIMRMKANVECIYFGHEEEIGEI